MMMKMKIKMSSGKSYLVIKVSNDKSYPVTKVKIVKEVKGVMACDVSPVANGDDVFFRRNGFA